MTIPSENETWLIEKGDEIIQKSTSQGMSSLSPWEQLVYCLWVADYSMRNAGDLETASDVYGEYKTEGLQLAKELQLSQASSLFSNSTEEMGATYFSMFESVCDELKSRG